MCARIQMAHGNVATADEFITQAWQAALVCQNAQTSNWVAAWQARLWLQQGRTESAAQWARQASLTATGGSESTREFEQLTRARLLLAQERSHEAFELLEPLRHAAQAAGHVRSTLEMLILQALAQQAGGHFSQALDMLGEAIVLAEPSGYVRLFMDEGEAMGGMLGRLKATLAKPGSRLSAYVDRIAENFPRAAVASQRMALLDPLTESEVQVLACIAQGFSNRAIALRLVVAQSTVEWHIKNLYSKMAVHSRTQAVAQARALGLLE